MKATCFVEVATPRGRKFDGCDLKCEVELPFVPHAGMELVVVPGDDYRTVEKVYWSTEDGLQIFFECEDLDISGRMKKAGWKPAD